MSGHLFVVNGDVTRIACDAVLIPVDDTWWVETQAFGSLIGMTEKGPVPGHPSEWPPSGMWRQAVGSFGVDGALGQPDIWVGDIGRQLLPDSIHFAERGRSFIAEAAAAVRSRGRENVAGFNRRPLLCMNVLGSGAGGKRSQRGQLLDALVPALIDAAISNDADVVLVCHGLTMYAAAQSVRRRLAVGSGIDTAWAGLSAPLREEGSRLADIAREGHLVLFMGAGVSADVGVPAWKPLLESLARDLLEFGEQDLASLGKLDARDQAHLIELRAGRLQFKLALEEKMKATHHGLAHALLASLPCVEAVTTNFDELFEHACETPGSNLSVIPGGEVRPGGRWLLKLHGTLGGDLVFTRSDYFSASSNHAALRGIVQAMLLTRHMLFVGYSLADEDFNQLVHEVRQARGEMSAKLGTALFPEGNPFLSTIWSDLQIVSTDEAGLEFHESVRRLWMLIDWIGMQASSQIAHLADESFGELHSAAEVELSDLVSKLIDFRSRVDGESSTSWRELDQFLGRFGRHD